MRQDIGMTTKVNERGDNRTPSGERFSRNYNQPGSAIVEQQQSKAFSQVACQGFDTFQANTAGASSRKDSIATSGRDLVPPRQPTELTRVPTHQSRISGYSRASNQASRGVIPSSIQTDSALDKENSYDAMNTRGVRQSASYSQLEQPSSYRLGGPMYAYQQASTLPGGKQTTLSSQEDTFNRVQMLN